MSPWHWAEIQYWLVPKYTKVNIVWYGPGMIEDNAIFIICNPEVYSSLVNNEPGK